MKQPFEMTRAELDRACEDAAGGIPLPAYDAPREDHARWFVAACIVLFTRAGFRGDLLKKLVVDSCSKGPEDLAALKEAFGGDFSDEYIKSCAGVLATELDRRRAIEQMI